MWFKGHGCGEETEKKKAEDKEKCENTASEIEMKLEPLQACQNVHR